MKNFIAGLLLLLMAPGQNPMFLQPTIQSGANCALPAGATYVWDAINPSNQCAGIACTTNGQTFSNVYSLVGTCDATNDNTTDAPVYTLPLLNGFPGFSFTPGGDADEGGQFLRLDMSCAISGNSSGTFAVIGITPNVACQTTSCAIFGGQSAAALEWGIGGSSGKQFLNSQYTTALAAGTNAVSTSSPSTLVAEYNTSTGTSFYQCAALSCNTDGGSSSTTTFGATTNDIGAGQITLPDSEFLYATAFEFIYYDSIGPANRAAIALRSKCTVGI
jgi:hypothetical protein